jgi:uncharacterized membrane protein
MSTSASNKHAKGGRGADLLLIMVNNPVYIVVVLLVIEAVILMLADRPIGKKLFRFLPSMFWIYFLPMLAATVGILPESSRFYTPISRWVLPAALILLMLSADIGGILRLGPKALGMMAAGVAGIAVGAPVVTLLYRAWLPEEAWKGIGALSASWIGGSANMIAVREAIGTPKTVFGSIVIVDTIIPYVWMGLLITLSVYQAAFDRWNKSDIKLLDKLSTRAAVYGAKSKSKITIPSILFIIALCAIGTWAVVFPTIYLPRNRSMINPAAWTIILATLLGIGLSFTPARKLESRGSNSIGFALLYFVLASIGAQTNFSKVSSVPILLLAGITWIAIHALFLLIAARLLKAPMALAAAASQASIGGPASAPVVAAIYHSELASVGLLLAVLGNILGTFLGLCISRMCYWVW